MPDTKRAKEIIIKELHNLGFKDTDDMPMHKLTERLHIERMKQIDYDHPSSKYF